jgi:hypothetical protein
MAIRVSTVVVKRIDPSSAFKSLSLAIAAFLRALSCSTAFSAVAP